MNGFKAFKLYTALKLHFTNPKFDVFTNKGHLKGSYSSFLERNDYALFERLATVAKTEQELIRFIAANFMYDHFDLVYNLELGEDNYKLFIARRQSITRVFQNDLDIALNNHCRYTKDNLVNESIPDIVNLYLQKKITLETMVILDHLDSIVEKQKSKQQLQLMFGDQLLKIEKSRGFVRYDAARISPVYMNFVEESEGATA